MRTNFANVIVQFRLREPQSQHRLSLFVNLDGPRGLEARKFKAEVEAADASEERPDSHSVLRADVLPTRSRLPASVDTCQ